MYYIGFPRCTFTRWSVSFCFRIFEQEPRRSFLLAERLSKRPVFVDIIPWSTGILQWWLNYRYPPQSLTARPWHMVGKEDNFPIWVFFVTFLQKTCFFARRLTDQNDPSSSFPVDSQKRTRVFQNPPVIPWVWRCLKPLKAECQEVLKGWKWHLLRRCLDI